MLDTDTKRRIDTARDILVGKVPDPKSQVEQITIALIYKFMDDIDAQSEELGGERSFFTGDFARYGWAKLMRAGLGGHDTLNLYDDAIRRMPQNSDIPQLFRNIFKDARLPYGDPETLRAFLKIIDEFNYDHSERLGDAFEYLLSVLGSQGDAGQFRTPRHIIDFMVEVVDPKKDEKILDPACGTAGFLISAYKHILQANTDENGGSKLSSDERMRLAANLKGYDISPDMVRLSLANMYLHGFTDPHISEYDTLTSEDNWNEFADVILANPPFMSPKGGIRPHNRFSVNSKRSEVLFVDYMAGHLGTAGRAGIIVPEGIIFQSQNAYKQLRKMLVEDYLVAVVSLPPGVFQPYSGVKTSVLILDKPLAKRANHVAFFKIENDGYDLGAQRRSIEGSDLPGVKTEIAEYLRRLRAGESVDDFESARGLIVEKEKITENGEYNLIGERYRVSDARKTEWPMVELGELFGKASETILPELLKGLVTYIGLENITQNTGQLTGKVVKEHPAEIKSLKNMFQPDDILYGKLRPNLNKVWLSDREGICSTDIFVVRSFRDDTIPAFYAYTFRSEQFNSAILSQVGGAQLPRVGWQSFANIQIPLPPLDIQKEIVAEIEGYQKVIDGARTVVDNYRPHIAVDPEWPMVALGEIARLINGRAYKREELLDDGPTPVLRVGNFFSNRNWYYSDLELDEDKYCDVGDLLYAWSASFGPRIWEGPRAIFHYHIWKIETTEAIERKFLFYLLEADSAKIRSEGHGIAMLHATKGGMEKREFPLPPLETQQAIVAELEAEQTLVDANRKLIERFEKKIEAAIARVWGEDA